jgi:hypothetical protein
LELLRTHSLQLAVREARLEGAAAQPRLPRRPAPNEAGFSALARRLRRRAASVGSSVACLGLLCAQHCSTALRLPAPAPLLLRQQLSSHSRQTMENEQENVRSARKEPRTYNLIIINERNAHAESCSFKMKQNTEFEGGCCFVFFNALGGSSCHRIGVLELV